MAFAVLISWCMFVEVRRVIKRYCQVSKDMTLWKTSGSYYQTVNLILSGHY